MIWLFLLFEAYDFFTSFLFHINHSVTVYVCFFFHFIFFRQKGVVKRKKNLVKSEFVLISFSFLLFGKIL